MKHKKRIAVFLWVAGGLVVVWVAAGFFLFTNNGKAQPQTPESIYVSSDNVKQGDTVFIKVKSDAWDVAGTFDSEKLVFYKKANSNEWISFLGIDVDQTPGVYEISVNKKLTKEIKVSLASFSTAVAAPAPSSGQAGITQAKAVSNIRNNDNPVIYKVLDNLTAAPYFNSAFTFPLVSMRTGGFSFGRFIGFGKAMLQHLGVDLKASEKTKIYAINDGKVVATVDLSNYGKTVIIDHGLDIFSMYLHLDEFKVAKGQMVKKDQVIGLSGNTGYVTGPHLHFSVRVNGTRVDPIAFIETTKQMDNNSVTASVTNAFSNIFR